MTKDLTIKDLLLISDIDGTLVTGKGVIPDRNLEAIARFTSEGGRFALATGRSVLGAVKYAERVPLNAPSVVYNGGGIYDFGARKLLWSTCLPESYRDVVRKVKKAFPEVGIEVYSGGGVFYISRNRYTKEHLAFQGITAEDRPPEDMPAACNKVLFCGDADVLTGLASFLEECPNGGWVTVFSAPIYYEMLPEGISKGVTIRTLADMLGVRTAGVMTIGDYYNDIEMLRAGAVGAAPAEAPDEVKAAAQVVVGPCEGGAVADFIEYLEARFQS